MDRYFPSISKKSSLQVTKNQNKTTSSPRFQPCQKAVYSCECRSSQPMECDLDEVQCKDKPGPRSTYKEDVDGAVHGVSSEAITRTLLNTLSDETNPITHSNISQRSDRVVSATSGHQVSEERINRRLYMNLREQKLGLQRELSPEHRTHQVMHGIRIYIDGYLAGSTDIEMKRIVTEAGGRILSGASRCTHILTSQWLSGSKIHKFLNSRSRNKVFVVRPEWVIDSIAAGKRRPEREYSVVNNGNTLYDMLKK